jgi:hypothetical protein
MTCVKNRVALTRAQLLLDIEELSCDSFVSARHAAAVLDTSPSVLANWRSQRRGPRYCGNGDFIRYQLRDLHSWMSQRAGEIRCGSLVEPAELGEVQR